MSTESESLYHAIMQLPAGERLELAVRVMDSVPPDFPGHSFDDPELLDELDRRSANLEGAVPWSILRNEE